MNTFYLDTDIVTLCEHFANSSYRTNIECYKTRNQCDVDKIKNDIFIGKLAEFAVFFVYLKRGRSNVTAPDLKIYKASDKSFDPDLRWGLYNLHIKSQTSESANRFGDSWIFQAKDPLLASPNEYDIIIGCKVSYDSIAEGYYVEIMLEEPATKVIVKEPALAKFGTNKRAIYLKDNK